ncbi:hypothetical protein [Leucobacter celer]|uniref:hypothetical protein n=1 Tax=Leucobacter celer TaxID=668625 RepID=UPI0006A7AB60|nr:hypothetical protein [Leucobacter celer]
MSNIETLVPKPADIGLAASAPRGLDVALGTEDPLRPYLTWQADEVEVPRSALTALTQVLYSFTYGVGVTVFFTRRQSWPPSGLLMHCKHRGLS